MAKVRSVNPSTFEVNQELELLTREKAAGEVEKARRAFPAWKALPARQRGAYIGALVNVLMEDQRQYAATITREMGKPIRQAMTEIERCANICNYFAEHADELTRDEIVATRFKRSYVTFEPLGVILGIMPWNFPIIQLFRFAIPTMVTGNVVVLKPASNVPLCGQAIESMFKKAGFPKNVFKTVLVDSTTAMALIKEDKVDGVSLTGSLHAGSQVAALAGAGIKNAVLELGGSDPFIVLEDVDVDQVAASAVQMRFVNCGQSCVAAKRFIVVESIAKDFADAFIKHLGTMEIGDPMDEKTDIGPLAMEEAIADLQRVVSNARSRGATIIEGPKPPDKGAFFRPVVVLDANQEMAVAREETFGPIAPIFTVRDDEEAVRVANSTEFGLGATIWSRNIERAERIARRIDSGFVGINQPVKSDPRLPFGGTKKSGTGRELARFGVREFANIKTVIIEEPK
jgi:succinate-semialdehyde dehydrogenase/glutarate-semialdehyde dehydrogenase